MANREDLYRALKNADAAGDVDAARRLAQYIKSLPAETASTPATPAPAAAPTQSGALDAPNAVATGFNRGLARLAGLPADTAANVIDLVKAAAGTPWLLAGKTPPEMLEVGDRSKVVASGDYLIDKARKTAAGRVLMDPQNPEYEGGYLQNMGGALTSVVGPATIPQAAVRTGGAIASSVLSKAVGDATGDPALAITASMIPGGAKMAAAAGVKRAVRGGEAGRRAMEQRVQDLRNAGIDEPTVGLASGNPVVGGFENILQSTPGAVGIMRRAREKIVNGIEGKVNSAADTAAAKRAPDIAGTMIQRDLKWLLKDRVQSGYAGLIDEAEQAMGQNALALPRNTVDMARTLNAPRPGAAATSELLVQPRIQALGNALDLDSAGLTQPIPFATMKELRTKIGKEGSSNAIIGTPEQAQFKQLYGAMTEDMRAAARAADLANGPQVNNLGRAERNLQRANDFYSAGKDRIDRVQPFATKDAPEQALNALLGTAKENNTTLQAVKKSISPEARANVAATLIDKLGKANPSNQNEVGDVFSPERFLTNWNTMTPKARRELFSGFANADKVRADIEAAAKAASMMRDNSKMWANPSGTAANLAARGTIGAGAFSAMFNPLVAAGVGAGLVGTNRAAKALTDPRTINWLSARDQIDPAPLRNELNQLVGMGLLGIK